MRLFDPIVKKNLSGTRLLVVHHRISHFSVLKSVSFLQFNITNIKREVFISLIPIKSRVNPSQCDSICKQLTLWGRTAIQSPQHIFGEG